MFFRRCKDDGKSITREDLYMVFDYLEAIMADIAQVQADFDNYKNDVAAAFQRLHDAITAAGGVPADVQAGLDALDAAILAADAEAQAEGQ